MPPDDRIHVKVHSYGPGRPLAMVYFDPITGKKVARSAETTDHNAAERAAAVWEDELNTGRYSAPSRVTWQEFRDRFDSEKLAAMPESTQVAYTVALDHLSRTIDPDRLGKLTAAVMSRFQSELRKAGMKETTIARHLRHVKAALNWAERIGLLAKAPKIEMPKRQKGQKMMRGRPITAEEFDRLLVKVPKVRPKDSAAWVRYLNGLWLSGLRLEESLALSWDQDAPFSVDLTGRRPAFRIYAEAQKANRDELLPMTPDFAEWLLTTPEADRVGPVFKLLDQRTGRPLSLRVVGGAVAEIGRKAKVIVNKAEGKYASAHDLRRAFGTRWAKRVMPAVLKRLMRHAEIGTTMAYYVDLDAAEVADQLWAAHEKAAGNTSGNNGPKADVAKTPANDVTPCQS